MKHSWWLLPLRERNHITEPIIHHKAIGTVYKFVCTYRVQIKHSSVVYFHSCYYDIEACYSTEFPLMHEYVASFPGSPLAPTKNKNRRAAILYANRYQALPLYFCFPSGRGKSLGTRLWIYLCSVYEPCPIWKFCTTVIFNFYQGRPQYVCSKCNEARGINWQSPDLLLPGGVCDQDISHMRN